MTDTDIDMMDLLVRREWVGRRAGRAGPRFGVVENELDEMCHRYIEHTLGDEYFSLSLPGRRLK